MADEARLIFELVDRSGSAAQPGASASQGGPPPPGSGGDPVGDAQQRNRPNAPQPSGPQPVQPVSPESPRPNAPSVQPSAQPDSRWGDLIATLTDIGKTLGLTATLQQTAAGQILSFGARAFSAAEKAADALQKFVGKDAGQQPQAAGGAGASPVPPTSPVPPVTVETVQPTAPSSPTPEAAGPIAPEPPQRSPFDNGEVIEGFARPALPEPTRPQPSGPAIPSPAAPEPVEVDLPEPAGPSGGGLIPAPPMPPGASGGPLTPRPSLPAVAGPSAGLPATPTPAGLAVPSAAAAAPMAPLTASAATLAAVAVPVAVVAAGAYGAYKIGEATNAAARQIAAGDAGGLSPDIARANAEQNIRELAANLMTAARVGDLVADNVAARGRMTAEIQELRDTVLATTLPATNLLTNAIAGAVAGLNDITQLFGGESTAKAIGDLVAFLTDLQSGGAFGIFERYAKAAEEESMRKMLAESPLTAFESEPLISLPAPFTADDEMPLDAKFKPIPGLEL